MKQQKAEWFSYDWGVENDEAVFCVDMALYELAPSGENSMLLYLNCAAAEGKPLDARLEKRADGILKKCLKKLDVLYAGFIRTGESKQFYFYAPGRASLNALKELIQKEKALLCRAGAQDEPAWQTYFELLYPDAAKLQTDENRRQLALLKKHGDNPAAPRRVRLHVYFPSESVVRFFAEAARQKGFAVGDFEHAPEYDTPYGIALHKVTSLEKSEIDAITTVAIRAAEGYGGVLRDWDCPIMPKKKVF